MHAINLHNVLISKPIPIDEHYERVITKLQFTRKPNLPVWFHTHIDDNIGYVCDHVVKKSNSKPADT